MMSPLVSEIYDRFMTVSNIASVAGAVSAVAFIVSLLLLNLQVHAADKNQRGLIQQGRAGRTADIAMRLMASDFAIIVWRCKNGDPSITGPMLYAGPVK